MRVDGRRVEARSRSRRPPKAKVHRTTHRDPRTLIATRPKAYPQRSQFLPPHLQIIANSFQSIRRASHYRSRPGHGSSRRKLSRVGVAKRTELVPPFGLARSDRLSPSSAQPTAPLAWLVPHPHSTRRFTTSHYFTLPLAEPLHAIHNNHKMSNDLSNEGGVANAGMTASRSAQELAKVSTPGTVSAWLDEIVAVANSLVLGPVIGGSNLVMVLRLHLFQLTRLKRQGSGLTLRVGGHSLDQSEQSIAQLQ